MKKRWPKEIKKAVEQERLLIVSSRMQWDAHENMRFITC